ncbi:MAG: hypothetical protein LQ349_009024 [Xanthoria aureola]|nr:MAG: hypothetical protein LQ349_009024 [Xanthoria aureola]
MALPYPEGEVLFRRSALSHQSGFNASNAQSFYSHALVETAWNMAFVQGLSVDTRNWVHPRSPMNVVKGQMWRTYFGFFDFQRVSFGPNKTGSGITRRVALGCNDNGNEARDFDSGGPHKVCIMPVRLGNEPFMFLDCTAPIRAVYFPLAHVCSEAFPDICSYLMVDFRLRETINFYSDIGIWNKWRLAWLSDTEGLGREHWNCSLVFDLQGIYHYLSLPRQLRHPDQGLYNAKSQADILISMVLDRAVTTGVSENVMKQREQKVAFNREMDLARVVSANLGVDLVWAPYEYSSFLFNLFTGIAELALGFIPVVGPLLSFGFSITVTAITDPDFFRADNLLDLKLDFLEAILDSGVRTKKYMTPGFSFASPGKRSADSETYKLLISSMKEKVERDGFKPSKAFAARLEGLDDCAGHEPGFRRQPLLMTADEESALPGEQEDGAHGQEVSEVVLHRSQQPRYGKGSVKFDLTCESHRVKECTLKFD